MSELPTTKRDDASGPDRRSSMHARVAREFRIPTADEDDQPRVEELEVGDATYTKGVTWARNI